MAKMAKQILSKKLRVAWFIPTKPDKRGQRIPERVNVFKSPLGLFAVFQGGLEGKLVREASLYDTEVDALNALNKGTKMWLLDEGPGWRNEAPNLEEVTVFPSYNEYSRRRGTSIPLTPVADKEGNIRTLSPEKRDCLFVSKKAALAKVGETIEKKIVETIDAIKRSKTDLADTEEDLAELKHWRGLCRRAKVSIKPSRVKKRGGR